MPRQRAQLAKLTPPRLPGVVERERLFAQLDLGRTRRLIWVSGPPGAGKTTLVSSWLTNRRIIPLWFQVDAADADLATFLHYLKRGAESISGRARLLPQLAHASQPDIATLARRFFRELFELLPHECVPVFDNVQDAGSELLVVTLTNAADELPAGRTILAISREQPPAACARLIAGEALTLVDATELLLTEQETLELLSLRIKTSSEVARRVHARAEGWAAGVSLIVESLSRSNCVGSQPDMAMRETLFGYFADQVFARASASVQRMLLSTSVLPSFDAEMAGRLSGVSDARRMLDDLCRRRLFTERRGTFHPSYQYHALFREYLRDRATSELSAEDWLALERRAARLLDETGQPHEAFSLSCAAHDWGYAIQLLMGNAESLLDQGRWRTVLDWIGLLPLEHAAADPWIQYWRGLALMPGDLGTSGWVLEHACTAFQRTNDEVGMCLSAAGLIDTFFYEYSDFRPADRWIDLLQKMLQAKPRFSTHSAELKAYGSAAMGLLFRRPDDAMLIPCIDRIQALMHTVQDVNRKVATALYLVTYCSWAADFTRLTDVAETLESLAEDPDVAEINRYHCLDWLSYFYTIQGDHERGERLNARAYVLAESSGDRSLRLDLLLTRVFLADQRDDAEASRLALEEMAAAGVRRPFDRYLYDMGRVKSRLTCADLEGALHAGRAVVKSADAIGIPCWQGIARAWSALALIELRRFAEAQQTIDEGLALVRNTCLAQALLLLTSMDALCKLRQARLEEAGESLRDLFSLAGEGQRWGLFARIHRYISELCAAALELNIEREHVVRLIGRSKWPAPAVAIRSWPWPIRIFMLGAFALELNGRPVAFDGKAPRRVLALLKVLVALGAQRVPRQQLLDALWQEQDGDSANASLNVAVVRLRKLLGRADAVLVSNEMFSLNRQLCWSDVWAFDHLDLSGVPPKRALRFLCAHYPGDFLPGDAAEAWSVRIRLRLRTRFIAEAGQLGRRLEAEGALAEAADLYRRAMATDDLAEEFYQGLMRCHLAYGDASGGMIVFRRLRQVLSVVLGIAPSSQTEALARRLRELHPANVGAASCEQLERGVRLMTTNPQPRSVQRP